MVVTELDLYKTRLGITGTSQDELLTLILADCLSEAQSITRQTDKEKLATVVRLMAVEKYNRLKSEGLSSVNYSGISESYESDYSQQVKNLLNNLRKVKVV